MRLPTDTRMPAAGQFRFGMANPAAAGSSQATATQLTAQVNVVTAADGTKAVALPDTKASLAVYILNNVTTAILPVYPYNGSGDAINGGSADAAFNLGAGQGAWFIATSAAAWYTPGNAATPVSLAGLLATVAELNRAADASTRVVTLAVTTTITELLHDGKLLVMAGAGAARTFTLPAASGSGCRFRFIVGTVNTSNYLIKAASGADIFRGTLLSESSSDSATDAVNSWTAGATDDTITLDGTTMGGVTIGDWIEIIDIATNKWAVTGVLTQSGTEATPFSDTVT